MHETFSDRARFSKIRFRRAVGQPDVVMALAFPNRMCSIDNDSEIIRFSGHDGVMEIRFSMALSTLDTIMGAGPSSESEYLSAFEQLRSRIQKTAVRVYNRNKKSFYTLTTEQF